MLEPGDAVSRKDWFESERLTVLAVHQDGALVQAGRASPDYPVAPFFVGKAQIVPTPKTLENATWVSGLRLSDAPPSEEDAQTSAASKAAVEESFMRLCEALGIAATEQAFLEGAESRRHAEQDKKRLSFVLRHGLPMRREGAYRYHGVSRPLWHPTPEEAIDAALADDSGDFG